MKTNSPLGCWQTDKETEGEEQEEERERQRGACNKKKGNKMEGMGKKTFEAGCKEWKEKVRKREGLGVGIQEERNQGHVEEIQVLDTEKMSEWGQWKENHEDSTFSIRHHTSSLLKSCVHKNHMTPAHTAPGNNAANSDSRSHLHYLQFRLFLYLDGA